MQLAARRQQRLLRVVAGVVVRLELRGRGRAALWGARGRVNATLGDETRAQEQARGLAAPPAARRKRGRAPGGTPAAAARAHRTLGAREKNKPPKKKNTELSIMFRSFQLRSSQLRSSQPLIFLRHNKTRYNNTATKLDTLTKLPQNKSATKLQLIEPVRTPAQATLCSKVNIVRRVPRPRRRIVIFCPPSLWWVRGPPPPLCGRC